MEKEISKKKFLGHPSGYVSVRKFQTKSVVRLVMKMFVLLGTWMKFSSLPRFFGPNGTLPNRTF